MTTPRKQSTSPPTSPASTTPPCGATRAPAARSTSPSFEHFARTAERGRFDFFFLAEGLRLREHMGTHPRPRRRRPPEHARRARRAGRRHRPHRARRHAQRHLQRAVRARPPARDARPPVRRARRLERRDVARTRSTARTSAAAASSTTPTATSGPRSSSSLAKALWDAWSRGRRSSPTPDAGRFLADDAIAPFAHRGAQFDIEGRFNVPRSPQGHPVIVQAGDSADGRDFAAAARRCRSSRGTARSRTARQFYRDVKGRLAASRPRPRTR